MLFRSANTRESHAERTAQRQAQFELEQQRKDRELEAKLKRDSTTELMKTAADIRTQGRKEMMAAESEATPE